MNIILCLSSTWEIALSRFLERLIMKFLIKIFQHLCFSLNNPGISDKFSFYRSEKPPLVYTWLNFFSWMFTFRYWSPLVHVILMKITPQLDLCQWLLKWNLNYQHFNCNTPHVDFARGVAALWELKSWCLVFRNHRNEIFLLLIWTWSENRFDSNLVQFFL